MKTPCKCEDTESPARLLLDGREIAKGFLKLKAGGNEGWFMPDSVSLAGHVSGESIYPVLVADLGTHQHHVRNVQRLVGRDGHQSLTAGNFGEVVVNERFYFDVTDA